MPSWRWLFSSIAVAPDWAGLSPHLALCLRAQSCPSSLPWRCFYSHSRKLFRLCSMRPDETPNKSPAFSKRLRSYSIATVRRVASVSNGSNVMPHDSTYHRRFPRPCWYRRIWLNDPGFPLFYFRQSARAGGLPRLSHQGRDFFELSPLVVDFAGHLSIGLCLATCTE